MKRFGSDSVAPLSAPEAERLSRVPDIHEDALERDLAAYQETAPEEEKEALKDEFIRTHVLKELKDMGSTFIILKRVSKVSENETRRLGARTLLEDRIGKAVETTILKKDLRTDVLTQGLNRRAYQEDVDVNMRRSIETMHPLWCMAVDVDGLKQINDLFGHEAGNKVLKILTKRMEGVIRSGDTIYRVGGDEFMVLSGAEDERVAQAIAGRLLRAVESRVFTINTKNGTRRISMSISIGISRFKDGDQGKTISERKEKMEEEADIGLYSAKKGKNRAYLAGELVKLDDEVPSSVNF